MKKLITEIHIIQTIINELRRLQAGGKVFHKDIEIGSREYNAAAVMGLPLGNPITQPARGAIQKLADMIGGTNVTVRDPESLEALIGEALSYVKFFENVCRKALEESREKQGGLLLERTLSAGQTRHILRNQPRLLHVLCQQGSR